MADYKVSKLSLDISTNLKGAIDSLNMLQSSLIKTDTNTKSAVYSLQKMSGTMSNMGRIVSTGLGFGSLQQSLGTLANWFKAGYTESSKFIENYNLFNVSFKGNTEQALKFQYELNRAFKTNMSETLRYQGFFENLGTSLGITGEQTQVLSENLTKLTYDISSLFNIDVATAYSKLSSGLVGQTKPLRNLGIDVTMQTLQTDLDRLGINAQVGQLTQAEKVLLRYIAILRQSTNAQGDFARTIETPVNQFRIFNAQIQEMTRWFGTLFLGAITNVLPYINAVVIGLKDIFMTFSTLMGFDVNDFNFLGSDNGTDVIDGIDNVTDSISKLNKSLYSFDELNNISQTSGILGDIGAGSYYDQLANYIKGYDNGMTGLSSRADEIKNKIFNWIGIIQNADGKIIGLSASLKNLISPIEGIWESLQNLKVGKILDYDYDGITKGLSDVWIALSMFTKTMIDGLVYFFNTFIEPMLNAYVTDSLPLWLEAVATTVDTLRIYLEDASPMLGDFVQNILLPLGKLSLGILNTTLSIFIGLMKELSKLLENDTFQEFFPLLFGPLGIAYKMLNSAGDEPTYNPNETYDYNDFGYTPKPVPTPTPTPAPIPVPSPYGNVFIPPEIDYGTIMYADGGFPTIGQAFIARENGPELVGSIGGRTAVANNGQIVEAVSQGVAIAVSSVLGNGGNNTVNIYLDDVLTGTALINSINRATKVTGNAVLAR